MPSFNSGAAMVAMTAIHHPTLFPWQMKNQYYLSK
jgi:hypothetical protein